MQEWKKTALIADITGLDSAYLSQSDWTSNTTSVELVAEAVDADRMSPMRDRSMILA
jgi:hypothetical protein